MQKPTSIKFNQRYGAAAILWTFTIGVVVLVWPENFKRGGRIECYRGVRLYVLFYATLFLRNDHPMDKTEVDTSTHCGPISARMRPLQETGI